MSNAENNRDSPDSGRASHPALDPARDIEPKDAVVNQQFARFYEIVRILRGPLGCPWDREQTPDSLKGFLLEEAFECIDAISSQDSEHVAEELGDVFLIAAMIGYVYEQSGEFRVERVFRDIGDKLIRRHPHVFSGAAELDSEAVKRQWDDIKIDVEGKDAKQSLLDKVPRGFSPLEAAYRLQRKAAKVGFDWSEHSAVVRKIREEVAELEAEIDSANQSRIEQEVGDLLFSVVNLARKLEIDPTLALHHSNEKFRRRFAHVEREMHADQRQMSAAQQQLMDKLWNEAKQREG